MHVWFDGPGRRLRMDVYGGLDSTYALPVSPSSFLSLVPLRPSKRSLEQDFTYNTFPRILSKACMKISSPDGPTAGDEEGGGNVSLLLNYPVTRDSAELRSPSAQPLPDISAWSYSGAAKMPGGTLAYVWTLVENHEQKTNTYTFYTAQNGGQPLKLVMAGVNILAGR